jgi:hypothetical protein
MQVRTFGAMRGAAVMVAFLSACGGSSSGPGPSGGPVEDPGPDGCEGASSYATTFAAIQEIVFERNGCTADACHGDARQGGLDLRRDASYESLVGAPSSGSSFARVLPGDQRRSSLWLKLAAKTEPGTVEIAGTPMPSGLPAITPDELEAIRLWIYAGAPADATVPGTDSLLDACLPPPRPITITPLEPPAPDAGVQLVMPEWELPAGTELEVCFASFYDFRGKVPDAYLDGSGTRFRQRTMELRQDPQSHHLIVSYAFVDPSELRHPSLGAWACRGGERSGAPCEPTDLETCGSGFCASEPQSTFGCIGFGPNPGGPGQTFDPIGGAQEAQARVDLYAGVYSEIPLTGVLFWNSHAFNLTTEDHGMNGRINYLFAEDQTYPSHGIFDLSAIFAPSAPPFEKQTVCNDHLLERGARLYALTSHTHKRGEVFWVDGPDGRRLYENYVYNDPVDRRFDPPLAFDAADAAARTLRYCAVYNNGVGPDGAPDPEAVSRRSRTPASALQPCDPVACATGRVGAPCAGVGDDATCDSAAGAGDGWCDACPITGGESTENEMFILIGEYFVPEG